jgi:CheY-like chemotaxis protein
VTAHPARQPTSRLRVLLVDDVADIRLLLRSLFAVYPGVEVVGEAGDGRQAIELAASTQPDLVVLDLSMPVMDGVAALSAIREAAPDARVVVLSAIPRSVDPGAMEAGAVAYVEKSATSTGHLVQDLLLGAGLLDSAMAHLEDPAQQAIATFARHPASAGRVRADGRHRAARRPGAHRDRGQRHGRRTAPHRKGRRGVRAGTRHRRDARPGVGHDPAPRREGGLVRRRPVNGFARSGDAFRR